MFEDFQNQDQSKGLKNLNFKESETVVSFVVAKFNSFKEQRANREEKWKDCIQAFHGQHSHKTNETRKWRSQVYRPLSYEAVTNIHSNIKRALFPTDSSFFSVEGKTISSKPKANFVKSLLLDQLDEMHFITKFGEFLKQLVVIGNSAAIVNWKQIYRKVKEEVEIPVYDEDGKITGIKLEVQEVEKIIYDGPEFQTINMFDIVFDASLTNWQDGLVIHQTYRSYDEIKNNPVYKNTDDLIKLNTLTKEYSSLQTINVFDHVDKSINKPDMVKLYSAYGDFKVGDKVYYDYIAVIANDKHLIRFEPNPYKEKPFIFCTYESIPNELYGLGAVEPALGIQNMVNTFSNQKTDVLSLIINGMWAYVDDGIIDPEEIVAKPGALIPVKNVNNIQPIHPDSSVIMSYSEISQLKAEYQEVTGATKYFTGGPIVDFEKTATEVSALKSAGVVRFSEVIQNIEENALKRSIKLIFYYNSSFNNDRLISGKKKNGKNYLLKYPVELLKDSFNFKITGANSSMSHDIRLNKLIEFIKIASSMPVISQQVNITELIKQLYRELGFKDENTIFNNY